MSQLFSYRFLAALSGQDGLLTLRGRAHLMAFYGIALATLACTLLGCSGSADTTAAEQAVSRFHELLDAGQSNQIYELSSDELKKASTQSDFVALLDAIHHKLGNVQSAEKQSWNTNYSTSGTFITLTYKTSYSEGEAAEQFVFRIQGDSAALAGYHINANALVVK